ncbi:MAG: sulfite exporter TauE/SafE family protein [Spirochaetes bacterium]|nr:sulfite exporter TauE/SafE family protein [Spirochaetota bacterium]
MKGLIAAIVVGFVTASIRSWVDRVFLVILLVGVDGLPIRETIVVNLMVVALAAVMMVVRQRKALRAAASVGGLEWVIIVVSAMVGGVAGRLVAANVSPKTLVDVLGIYAILVGLRIVFIKPLPEREMKAHPAWFAPVSLGSGLLAGFISAGGKPFAVPAYNNAMGHHPQRAYAFASLGVAIATWSAIATQAIFVAPPTAANIILALYEFVLVTLVALIVNKFWSEKLNKIVNLAIAPILIIVGIRFLVIAL